jgi:two-component system OmpR family sensor kinase
MDGLKGKLTDSLQTRLSLWLSLAIIVFAVCGGILSFNAAFAEADEFQDDQLRQIAGLMETQKLVRGAVLVQQKEKSADSESQIIVHVMGDEQVEIHALHHERLMLSPSLHEGMQTVKAFKYRWRLFVRKLPSGDKLVVGQRTDVRDELARNGAVSTLLPLLLLIPVLIILINVLIHQMIRPVTRLAVELDSRPENDLHALDDAQVPREIKPFTRSINDLLERVKRSVDVQRRFVADAAHELRSPLTALSLQAENLSKFSLQPAAEERLAVLMSGLSRSRLLLEQLLSLARSQTSTTLADERISIQLLFRRGLEDLIPIMELKHIDIEADIEADLFLIGQEIDGVTILKNLIGNAVRYTPENGRIFCRAFKSGDMVTIDIEDNGPGIPDEELERVFDPFYRVIGSDQIGSGLGLAIVKTIVERMHGKIVLTNIFAAVNDGPSPIRQGLKATIVLPIAAV